MKLTKDQIAHYNKKGYLKIDNFLDEQEVQTLLKNLPDTIEKNSPRIIFEDNGSVRSIFAPHFINETYRRLFRMEKLINPSVQLIGSKVYLHQYKINTKKGLKGDWWEWHQDFPYWHFDDGLKNPDLVTILIYLQDTDSSNGALLLIPKSHKLGIVKFANKGESTTKLESTLTGCDSSDEYLSSLNSNIKFTIDHEILKEFALKNGIETISGKKGSALFFHGNIFHASNTNLSPFNRDAILITYNSIHNLPQNIQKPRPEFLSGRDFQPIEEFEISLRPEHN